MAELHPLLARQLRRLGATPTSLDAASLGQLLEQVSRAYQEADDERYLVTRSIELSSAELLQANASLRASEAALATERDTLRAIISSIGDGLCVLDGDGHCTLMNPAAEHLLGWRQHEVGGTPLLERISGLT